MTASPAASTEDPRTRLAQDPSPAAIRGALLPDEADRFVTEYADALETAKATLDLSELRVTLDRWLGRALLQVDRNDFAGILRTAAERLTGAPVPVDEPLSATRDRLDL